MKTTIDPAGRLVIPKEVRREAGLRPGMVLDVRWRAGRIEIEPAPLPVKLVQKGRFVVAAPALVQAYAVLIRLPPPHRLSAADVLTLLEANFMRPGKIVALDGRSYRSLLRGAPENGIAGGRTTP